MPTLRPFRVVDDHDIINLYKWNPTGTYPVSRGTFVKVISGYSTDQELAELGGAGATYGNTVSLRYGVNPFVGSTTASGDQAIGVLLWDVREFDENGEKLLYNPDKQARMQCAISGQCVPIAKRGQFLYSGIQGTVLGNEFLYLTGNGELNAVSPSLTVTATKVGKVLGIKNAAGHCLIDINIQ